MVDAVRADRAEHHTSEGAPPVASDDEHVGISGLIHKDWTSRARDENRVEIDSRCFGLGAQSLHDRVEQ